MFKQPFSFEGRIGRAEYFYSYLTCWTIMVGLQFFAFISQVFIFFIFLGYIPLLWFMLAQGIKRCHDTGNSGWLQLIPGVFFWMMFAPGDSGRNKYGPSPKQPLEQRA
ncbi:DUF805 domain-containing protein [Dyadobacter fermentans]|uniref:DUF805 domain-containing protein n=1 Tax=Dyadobacter fermentans TaxID=94254 RepID=UPI001CBD3AAF|nr:DUF805 domain-containing protein [Dyadobacter fermentans]MBZ1363037.1 DUF805 domain-containing protein [Dyadobacter fermentans]